MEHPSLLQAAGVPNTGACHRQTACHGLETPGDATKGERQTSESVSGCPDQKVSEELSRKSGEEGSTGLATSAQPRLPRLPSSVTAGSSDL